MNAKYRILALVVGALGIIGVTIVLICLLWGRLDPCDHLFRVAAEIDRLESSGPPHLSDAIVGALHHGDPVFHYQSKFQNEKASLMASGQLVEFRIPYTAEGIHSDRQIAMALVGVHRRTGSDYYFEFDRTNRLMLIVCRARDRETFTRVLK